MIRRFQLIVIAAILLIAAFSTELDHLFYLVYLAILVVGGSYVSYETLMRARELGILQQRRDGSVEKAVFGRHVLIDAAIDDTGNAAEASDPEAAVARHEQGRKVVARKRAAIPRLPGHEAHAVEAHESRVRGNPEISRLILRDGPYIARGHAVAFGPRRDGVPRARLVDIPRSLLAE